MADSEAQSRIMAVKARIEKLISDGHLNEAKSVLKQIDFEMPGDPDICSMRAVIAIMEGAPEEAETYIEEGLKKDSVQFDLLYNLAYIRELQGLNQEAADLYCKAGTVADTEEKISNANNSINKLIENGVDIPVRDKPKLVFFVKKGMDSFLGDIINGLEQENWVRKIIVSDLKQIDDGMKWADICWFEWCDELVIYGTQLPLAIEKKIICRLHRYEVFSDYPGKVTWENVNKLVIVTAHLKRLLEINFPGITNRVEMIVIENGVDVKKFTFKNRSNGLNLAMVGYIHTRKNPVLLLQIIKKLSQIDKRYKLFIAGQFQEQVIKLYWEYQVERMGLQDNVIFEGWQNDINNWLEDKNYLVSTSIHESFGYGIAEAMARGIKPVIHDFLYANEVWDEKFLFNTVDEAVECILKGQYESEKYRAFIEDNYSLGKQLKKTSDLINTLLSEKTVFDRARDILSNKENPEELLVNDLTVLIPCYNRAKMIKEDIDKGLKLGKQPKMIIDDCSTEEEEWLSIIENERQMNKCNVIRKEKNSGVAESRRLGLENIKTKYTTFIDDDNIMACIDKAKAVEAVSKLNEGYSIAMPRYILNYYKGKLTLGYDRSLYDGMSGKQVLKELASSGEMMALLGGGAIGETEWMYEHSSCPLFRVGEDFVMLTRMMASKPEMKVMITDSLVFVRRFMDDCLTSNQNPLKLMLSLFSQAIACYYCLELKTVPTAEVLAWMKNRGKLIEKIYHFGEDFENRLIAYLVGETSEELLLHYVGDYGLNLENGLDELAPELRKMRALIYGDPGNEPELNSSAMITNQIQKNGHLRNFSDKCSRLYNINLVDSLSRSNKLFSVVIPTRNSAQYLRYALMTCINQNFKDYEIVVSDNSTPGNDETFRLIKELDSDKIRYIKPDKELSLAKSFEYAYLKAEGEYIFSLGSDDALLFHSLDTLNDILKKTGYEEVLLWDKLAYSWPGFANKSTENLFSVYKMYHKNEIKVNYLDCNELIHKILNFEINMYMLPMAYINSAIQRNRIKRIIDCTGCFLDGSSQDVYTGLINLALSEKVAYIQYPIVIAGTSNRSAGFVSSNDYLPDKSVFNELVKLEKQYKQDYYTKYVSFNMLNYDRALLVYEFLKVVDKHINNWNYDMVNWKKFFALCAENLKNEDTNFNVKLTEIYHTVKAHNNKELENWFVKNYYNQKFKGNDSNITYRKGFVSDANALIIDMSKFGIENIFDVAKFFGDLYNL